MAKTLDKPLQEFLSDEIERDGYVVVGPSLADDLEITGTALKATVYEMINSDKTGYTLYYIPVDGVATRVLTKASNSYAEALKKIREDAIIKASEI